MNCFCIACGFKNTYGGTKPKTCQACEESLEPKKLPPRKVERARYRDESEDDLPERDGEGLGVDMEQVRRSIRLEPEGNENTLMTIEQLRKSSASFERGGAPVRPELRDEITQGLITGKGSSGKGSSGGDDLAPPPDKQPRTTARRVGKLKR